MFIHIVGIDQWPNVSVGAGNHRFGIWESSTKLPETLRVGLRSLVTEKA